METLYCVNLSIVAYEDGEGSGHVILAVTPPDGERSSEAIDIQVSPVPGGGNARLWAKRVIALALAEL